MRTIRYLLPALLLCVNAAISAADESEKSSDDVAKEQVYASISADDEIGFERMGPPKRGEWLASFPETPQTMERYRHAVSVRPTEKRKVIVLQPLGTVTDEQQKVMQALCEYTQVFFQMPARVEKPIELVPKNPQIELIRKIPLGHRHGTYDKQYDAARILDQVLVPHLPDDAVVYLGITMEDLWDGNLNYVFGVGSMSERVGVYSLCRYYPEFWGRERKAGDDTLGLLRACKVLNHETGHMFGLGHCVFFHCSMNGSNDLGETDRAPVHFCPLCDRKLAWNIGFEPLKRYQALKDFYAKNGLDDEADWTTKRIKQWELITAKKAQPKDE
jgi:archaemetzincin